MSTIQETFTLAYQYHQAGAFFQAENLYRQILQSDASHAQVWCFLAAACQSQAKVEEAEANYRQALQLHPDYVEAHNNLGNVLLGQNKLEEAIGHFQEALRLQPGFALVHNNWALALERQHQLEEAIKHWREALRLQPEFAEVYCNMGNTLQSQGKVEEAISNYREAIRLKPNYAEAYNNLGNALRGQWKLQEALESYRAALQINPQFPEAICNMGTAWEAEGDLDEAVRCYQHALVVKPNYPEAHNNLAVAYMSSGRLDMAAASFLQALKLRPDLAAAHSSYLLCVNYDPDADPQVVFEEHCRWGRLHMPSTPPAPLANDPDHKRCIRVGYVSPDLRFHALTRYLEPVLANHDPKQVEVFCYADVANPDAVTMRLEKHAHGWRRTCGLSDAQLADRIREDRIDILVDLSGHTAGTRLRVFALKPAPIQMTWLGYLNTTGLSTVDYRLTDEVLDPPGRPVLDTEELMRLPGGFCCFCPPNDCPKLGPLPALARGYLTFGSPHNIFKLNAKVFDLWAQVLHAVPTSRLLVFRDTLTGSTLENVRRQFTDRGISSERLEMRRTQDARNYLEIYSEIDVGLDAFPWSGGVTTCESLWMGVPVLSLRGKRPAGRNSAALLTRVDLGHWAANTPEEFVSCARRLPNELEQLSAVRQQLRERMSATLCDGARFTRVLEEAYRTMWHRWCKDQSKK